MQNLMMVDGGHKQERAICAVPCWLVGAATPFLVTHVLTKVAPICKKIMVLQVDFTFILKLAKFHMDLCRA